RARCARASGPEVTGRGTAARTAAENRPQRTARRAGQSAAGESRSLLLRRVFAPARIGPRLAHLFSRPLAQAETPEKPADQRALHGTGAAGPGARRRRLFADRRRGLLRAAARRVRRQRGFFPRRN